MMLKLTSLKRKSAVGRLTCFIVCLAIVWFPFAIASNLLLKDNPNLATIITMGLLFCNFILLQKLFAKYIYRQPFIFQQYGFYWDKLGLIQLIKGLAIGFSFCLSLFVTEAILGWLYISNPSAWLAKIVWEGFISALGIAVAEELFFRGWILFELEQDYSKAKALWISSTLFAVAHFLKPISEIMRTFVTFPALLLLGLTLVWAKRAFKNYLTISIGIHGGLVWAYYILNVGNLVTYTNRVPSWITGIDNNPIAGILGLSYLTVLALIMKKQATIKQKIKVKDL